MPEAPEVANVLAWLEDELKGRKIVKAEITHPKLAQNMDPESFCRKLEGQTFREFHRYGKYLVFVLDDVDLVGHLRMEGKFLIGDPAEMEPRQAKHIHAVFDLDDGRKLCYYDTRKFGRMQVLDKTEDYRQLPVFEKLGKDVFDDSLNAEYLYQKLHKKRIPIKTALLDQSVIAGIGNIYADEILFHSRIHPEEPCCRLSMSDFSHIARWTKEVLSKSVESGGTTIRTFSYGNHQPGSFQDQLMVHQREGEPCFLCGTPVESMKVGQRSTCLCPQCQKRKS
ncbi:MAG: bifunctional DNA-formamidopyrimidine glycosylase/DNA-(apurinic or apyrimidinic site) lyase [Erysipelotrichaceae bacterium]|nr:bifunctional DNA-formamidopyrimidine glycosylase/DNA-(apurinic or apyrimidinic site) lyase [Erysipelotrichaceae bacterium]